MGLDMYLMKMPRYKNATAKDVTNVEDYLDWLEEKNKPESQYKDCTLKQW